MTIAVRASGSASFDLSAPGASKQISIPSGTQAGDLMVITFGLSKATTNIQTGDVSVPSGWTAIHSFVGTVRLAIWTQYRIAQAGDTNWTWNLAHGTDNLVGIFLQSFSGVDNGTPIDVTGTSLNSAGSASVTIATYTTLTDSAWIAIGCGCKNFTTTPVYSASGYTEADNGTASFSSAGLIYKTKSPAGATGSIVVSSNGDTSQQVIAASPFALRPTPNPPPPGASILRPQSRSRLAGPTLVSLYG